MLRAVAIARELDHPVYDCFYLAVSEALDAPLVTADGRLLARVAGTPFSRRTQGLQRLHAAQLKATSYRLVSDTRAAPSLETEALVGSILELAKLTDTPAPSIQAVYACVKLLNKVMLTEGGGVRLNKAAWDGGAELKPRSRPVQVLQRPAQRRSQRHWLRV